MYARDEDSDARDTSFGVSGKLWNGILVMYDRETESLWTAVDGRAIEGERQGERLVHVPSTYTTWDKWLAAHPDTEVLKTKGTVAGPDHSRYDAYFADPEQLFLPELAEGLGGVKAKSVVFGVSTADGALAVIEDVMQADGVFNGFVGDVPVALVRHADTGAVQAVDRRLDGKLLVLDGVDAAGRVRDRRSGRELSLDNLQSLRVDRAFWYAWKHSHPESQVVSW